MSKYLYMVNPRIPLKLCGEFIRRSKYVELDKEEVKYALKHGPVYRKFDAQTTERVTLQNLDELHVEKKGMQPETVVAEVKVEDVVTPVQDLPVKDEVVNVSEGETPEVDTIKDEPKLTAMEQVAEEQQPVSDHIESISEEVKVDADSEAVVEETEETTEDTTETTEEEEKQPKNNNYYRKKKRNR